MGSGIATDLVSRLRDPRGFDWGDFCALTTEAANEIEKLREALARLMDRVDDAQEAMTSSRAVLHPDKKE